MIQEFYSIYRELKIELFFIIHQKKKIQGILFKIVSGYDCFCGDLEFPLMKGTQLRIYMQGKSNKYLEIRVTYVRLKYLYEESTLGVSK